MAGASSSCCRSACSLPIKAGSDFAAGGKKGHVETTTIAQPAPDADRDPREFVELGGKGDQVLFDGEDVGDRSLYPDETTVKAGPPGT